MQRAGGCCNDLLPIGAESNSTSSPRVQQRRPFRPACGQVPQPHFPVMVRDCRQPPVRADEYVSDISCGILEFQSLFSRGNVPQLDDSRPAPRCQRCALFRKTQRGELSYPQAERALLPRSQVPQANSSIVFDAAVAGNQSLSIRTEGQTGGSGHVWSKGAAACTSSRVPETDCLVVTCRRQRLAVRTERHGPHGGRVASKRLLQLARGGVPEVDLAVVAPTGQPRTVGSEGHPSIDIRMQTRRWLDGLFQLAGGGFVELDGVDRCPRHGLPVRTESGSGGQRALSVLELTEELTGGHVPEAR